MSVNIKIKDDFGGIKKAPKYKENPFIKDALEVVSEKKQLKRQFMNGNRAVQQFVVNTESGEVVGETIFARTVEVDEDKFVKIFVDKIALLLDLDKPAIRVFAYIVEILKPNDDKFFVIMSDCLEKTKYASEKSIFLGLGQLIQAGIIARSEHYLLYFINPMFMFNGNRIAFAEEYRVKRKKKEINNPNQLNLLKTIENTEENDD